MRGEYDLYQSKYDAQGEHLKFKRHCCPDVRLLGRHDSIAWSQQRRTEWHDAIPVRAPLRGTEAAASPRQADPECTIRSAAGLLDCAGLIRRLDAAKPRLLGCQLLAVPDERLRRFGGLLGHARSIGRKLGRFNSADRAPAPCRSSSETRAGTEWVGRVPTPRCVTWNSPWISSAALYAYGRYHT
jgi:hypothetical protein